MLYNLQINFTYYFIGLFLESEGLILFENRLIKWSNWFTQDYKSSKYKLGLKGNYSKLGLFLLYHGYQLDLPLYIAEENWEHKITKQNRIPVLLNMKIEMKFKRQTITSVGENVDKLESSYTAGGTVKLCSHFWKTVRSSSKYYT